jgi:hypothetical protein
MKNIIFLMGVISIPTTHMEKWQIEKYSRIPQNEFSFSDQGLLVKVNKSASPLIYPLEKASIISGFSIQGNFLSLPRFKDISKQGSKGNDDYVLRIGFIVPGEKTLSGVKKMFAADWVKRLYARVPAGRGLGHIQFFNVTQNRDQVGTQRDHPLSDLLREEFFTHVSAAGPFEYKYELKVPIEAVALWMSIDGDDTASEYQVLIKSFSLTKRDP